MKCKNCNAKNLYKAHYCQKCGYAFTEENRKEAYSQTIFGFFDKIEEMYKKIKLDHITGSMYFKVLSILFVLAIGVFNVLSNGNTFKVLDSEQYDVQYNTKTEEYYLISEEDMIQVSLYLPKETKMICVMEFDDSGNEIQQFQYTIEDAIVLRNNGNVYKIEAEYSDDICQSLMIRIFE